VGFFGKGAGLCHLGKGTHLNAIIFLQFFQVGQCAGCAKIGGDHLKDINVLFEAKPRGDLRRKRFFHDPDWTMDGSERQQ
jgi:hypothetical protein